MSEENNNRKVSKEEAEIWQKTQVGIPIDRARAYIALSHIEFDKSNFQDALPLCQMAAEIIQTQQEDQYAPDLAHILDGIAQCYFHLERYRDEVEILEEALQLARRTGSGDEPELLRAQGRSYYALREDENSIRCHQAALAYPKFEIDEKQEAIDRLNIGMALARLTRFQEAINELYTARGIFKLIKKPKWVAICDLELTEIYINLKDGLNGQIHGQLALGTAQLLDDKHRQWLSHYYLGIAMKLQEEYEVALKHFEDGRSLALHFGREEFEYLVKVDREVARIYEIKGSTQKAEEIRQRISHIEEMLEIA